MPIKIFHLEYVFDGETERSFYTSLTALCIDNEGKFGLPSIHTLRRVKEWPYVLKKEYSGYSVVISIDKSYAYSTGDVKNIFEKNSNNQPNGKRK